MGGPFNQCVLLPMPWSGEGYTTNTASSILINLSSLKTSSHLPPRTDPLALKPGIHKNAHKASRTKPRPSAGLPRQPFRSSG